MEPPCRGCRDEHETKKVPFIWIERPPRELQIKDRSFRYIPGKNRRNSCYKCPRAQAYDDFVSNSIVGPPSSWPDGVDELLAPQPRVIDSY